MTVYEWRAKRARNGDEYLGFTIETCGYNPGYLRSASEASRTVMTVYEWRAKRVRNGDEYLGLASDASRTIVNICDRRAKRAETVMTVYEWRASGAPHKININQLKKT